MRSFYECSIRDMTAQKEIGVENPKTFPAFVQENATTRQKRTGLSYIRELGITHVQLMPVLDFGSVDEEYPSLLLQLGLRSCELPRAGRLVFDRIRSIRNAAFLNSPRWYRSFMKRALKSRSISYSTTYGTVTATRWKTWFRITSS